ncbi:diguanylate cyclase (GGDEF)-like protein [Lentzea flaviverrucosa]|uniref:Diguanylate cyclase (GGDEF) domain-containing protein n=1 Tax=Lentzea flaviverrucosa TaxID=200379 RepID=A0A1H9XTY5_9PSEU|nr:diguanylate cyclase [Lentzea flaviverrucosa]RDI18892.1 diguanylate cyclase (GGDEF)-like protein [Lentzea flaviverrucosa]SES49638.1 diguanylate cyclase (GGDEF) domain-containing protein [Lentzea flaviverrucosa]
MRDWPVWTLRQPALYYWLFIDIAALATVTYAIVSSETPSPSEIARFAAIAGTAGAVIIGSTIYSHRLGETERNPWAAHLCYLTAGILALPPNLLVLLLFGPALHCLLAQRPETHRWLFTLSATALAVFTTRYVLGWADPHANIVILTLAATLLLVLRAALIALGLKLRSPSATFEENVGEPIDAILGVVAVSIGGLMGCVAESNAVHVLIAGPSLALLERAAQLPQWRRSAQRDAKTGLANAVHWDTRARYELTKGASRTRPMAVMLLDLDHFKRVNDEVGHLAGDAALAAISLLLRGTVRRGDLVGRFGGEEFVVLLPEATPDEAEFVAERVRKAVAALRVPTMATDGKPHELHGLTVSIGVSTTTRFGYELPDLLVAADAALLAAKAYGRNLVSMA